MHISLQRIKGENFRAIQNEVSVNLSKIPAGLYFIAGRNEVEPRLGANGAAKSTLFVDLVYWVLTGKTARSQRPGGDVENWFTDEQTSGMLQFKVDDAIRTVERTRKPNTLKLDDKPAQQSEVDHLLPLAEAALRRTLLIDQFSQKFLDLRPEDKSRIFSETLNLDLWIQSANRASTMVTQLEGKLQRARIRQSGLESAIKEVRDQLEEAVKREGEFEAEIEVQLKELRTKRRAAANTSNDREVDLNEAREYCAEIPADNEIELNTRKTGARHLAREHNNALSKQVSVEQLRNSLNDRLKRYVDTRVCPECGQSVTDAHLQERRDTIRRSIVEYDEEYAACSELVTELASKIEANDRYMAELNNSLVEYHRRHALLATAIERAQGAMRELNSIRFQYDQTREKVNPFTKMVTDLQDRLKQLRADRDEVKALGDELDQDAEIYRFWQKGFRDIRLEQIDTTLMELEIAVNRHAMTLGLDGWEVQFSTEREKSTGGVSHAFTVSLYPPGQNAPVPWESYSGGESQRLQLAVTFGLAEILLARGGISTDFEVLDETSLHLSSEGIEDLLECLKDRAAELQRRIFVIDHHALDRGAFDGVLVCVKTNKGVSLEASGLMEAATQRERVRL